MGRNHKAFTYAAHYFSGSPKPLSAWVIGVGGGNAPATEHLEIALTLGNSGIRHYRVHALEPDEANLSVAKRALDDFDGVPAVFMAHDSASRTYALKDLDEQREYIRQLTGLKPTAGVPFRFHVSPEVTRRITWHGPGKPGNVLRSTPAEKPDLVTCLNVAQHYGSKDQRALADRLADSLNPGGLLLTNQRADLNVPFIRRLENRLSDAVVLERIPLVGSKEERLLAFHKGGLKKQGGVILLR